MPTLISDKEAKRTAARASLNRARQWRDDKRDAKSPSTKTAQTKSQAPKPPPKKPAAPKRTQSKAKEAPVTEEGPAVQYRKTPSREDRAKARAQARSNAREWSERKKGKVPKVEANKTGVPAVVETNSDDEVEDLSDDYKTAPATEAQMGIDGTTLKELTYLKNDVKNAFNRLESIVKKESQRIDAMECD